ncbi:hypothetical protein KR044_009139, partial [Drosophila immigrans]
QQIIKTIQMALQEFIAVSDKLCQFETRIQSAPDISLFTLKVRLDQICSLWAKVESECERCTKALCQGEANFQDKEVMQAKYDTCYSVYERCAARLNEQIERASPAAAAPQQAMANIPFGGCRLPPCDTEVFHGDYLRWPTFRDLFTAIYIDNPRLTPVEKLFHLNAKTDGDAKAIVAKSPLTNDGFASAWAALSERFENKRLLVNSQLKILFSLSEIQSESGAALK